MNAARLIKKERAYLEIMDELGLTGRLFHLRLLCGIVEEEELTGGAAAPR